MKFKKISSLLALVAAFASTGAMADDQSVTFASVSGGGAAQAGTSVWTAAFQSMGTALAGGDDVISFLGLTSGKYNFQLNFSGQNFILGDLTLNDQKAQSGQYGNFSFGFLEGSDNAPFVLKILGNNPIAATQAAYSGNLTVTKVPDAAPPPVPEPETYAMLLAGLAGIAFVVKRRRAA
ncbi:FxDxF family PEP-CTERM protein [Roseateles sp. PN1]|uniref:FxDxF family PEP-CTERM protein n=1 Tax=Roseateles sp. PN1 TaxID=3137372 RepID=UPI003139D24F